MWVGAPLFVQMKEQMAELLVALIQDPVASIQVDGDFYEVAIETMERKGYRQVEEISYRPTGRSEGAVLEDKSGNRVEVTHGFLNKSFTEVKEVAHAS